MNLFTLTGKRLFGRSFLILLIPVLLLLVNHPVLAQSYRTVSGGNWSDASNWEVLETSLWVTPGTAPSGSGVTVDIRAGHTISLTDARTINKAGISGVVNIQSGGSVFIDNDVFITGEMTIHAGGMLRSWGGSNYAGEISYASGAKININTGGKIMIGTGGAIAGTGLNGYATGANSVWSTGAVFEWNSTTALPISGLTYFPGVADSVTPWLVVDNTGGVMGGSASTVINGMLLVRTSFSLNGSGSKTIRDGIAGNAAITIPAASGPIIINGTNPILGGSNLSILTDKNISIPNGLTIPADSSVRMSTVTGAVFTGKGSNSIMIDGIMDMGTVTIDNSGGDVTINGTLKTAHPNGLEGGTINTPGVVNVNTGSTIEYNAAGNQLVTASAVLEGTAKYHNIVFSGSGIKSLTGAVAVSNNVRITGSATADALSYDLGSAGATLTMDAGRLQVGTAGMQPVMTGNYNITGGTVQFGANSTAQTIRGDASHAYFNVEVAGSNIATLTHPVFLNSGGVFTIKSTGVLTTSAESITGPSGSQAFVMETGSTLHCRNVAGFNAAAGAPSILSSVENITLQPGTTINYSRTGGQSITNTVAYQHLALSGSGDKTAGSGSTLVRGNFSRSGSAVFKHNNGTVVFNGSDQSFNNSTASAVLFYNVTNSSTGTTGLTINSDSMAIEKELLLSPGSKIRLAAGNIVLKSNAAGTANVAPVPAEANIISYTGSGRFIVERYISQTRKWQLIAVPAQTTQTIFQAWQDNGSSSVNPTGYGVQLTGPGANIATNGLDKISASASLKYYEPVTGTYVPVLNSKDSLLLRPGGYFLFFYGNRAATAGTPGGAPSVLRTTGRLFVGNPSLAETPPALSTKTAGEYYSAGNPFASAIDFDSWRNGSAVIDNSFRVWDPSLAGMYGSGGWQTISGTTGFIATPGTSTIFSSADTDYGTIQSGQAFFVRAASSGSIPFTESNKVSSSRLVARNGEAGRTEPGTLTMLSTMLFINNVLADGNRVVMSDDFQATIDDKDAGKMMNSSFNFGIVSNDDTLAVEARPLPGEGDTIRFFMSNLLAANYQLRFAPQHLAQLNLVAELGDRYLNTRTPISLTDSSVINFTVNNAAASKISNRFYLVFSRMAVLPVSFSSITASRQQSKLVEVQWTVEDEVNIKKYEIQRSENGTDYLSIGQQESNKGPYLFRDGNAPAGITYYRAKAFNENGRIEYSRVVKVAADGSLSSFAVYPNPSPGSQLNIRMSQVAAGTCYQLSLYDATGRLVRKEGRKATGTQSMTVHFKRALKSGNYRLIITDEKGNQASLPVLVK